MNKKFLAAAMTAIFFTFQSFCMHQANQLERINKKSCWQAAKDHGLVVYAPYLHETFDQSGKIERLLTKGSEKKIEAFLTQSPYALDRLQSVLKESKYIRNRLCLFMLAVSLDPLIHLTLESWQQPQPVDYCKRFSLNNYSLAALGYLGLLAAVTTYSTKKTAQLQKTVHMLKNRKKSFDLKKSHEKAKYPTHEKRPKKLHI